MRGRNVATLIGINALIACALIGAAGLWLMPTPLPALAVLDVAQLYQSKESQIAAVLVKSNASEAEREAALRDAAGFGAEMSMLLQGLPNECRCIVLARGAVISAEPALPDLTPNVRRRLGL